MSPNPETKRCGAAEAAAARADAWHPAKREAGTPGANERKSLIRELIGPSLSLLLICLLTTALLALVYEVTRETISLRAAEDERLARQAVLPPAEETEELNAEEVQALDAAKSEPLVNILGAYRGQSQSGEAVGSIFLLETNGYGGTLRLMVGLDGEARVSGLRILRSSETPGLGARASEPAFLDPFIGKGGGSPIVLNRDGDTNSVDSVSSATITSSAVVRAVNCALEAASALNAR